MCIPKPKLKNSTDEPALDYTTSNNEQLENRQNSVKSAQQVLSPLQNSFELEQKASVIDIEMLPTTSVASIISPNVNVASKKSSLARKKSEIVQKVDSIKQVESIKKEVSIRQDEVTEANESIKTDTNLIKAENQFFDKDENVAKNTDTVIYSNEANKPKSKDDATVTILVNDKGKDGLGKINKTTNSAVPNTVVFVHNVKRPNSKEDMDLTISVKVMDKDGLNIKHHRKGEGLNKYENNEAKRIAEKGSNINIPGNNDVEGNAERSSNVNIPGNNEDDRNPEKSPNVATPGDRNMGSYKYAQNTRLGSNTKLQSAEPIRKSLQEENAKVNVETKSKFQNKSVTKQKISVESIPGMANLRPYSYDVGNKEKKENGGQGKPSLFGQFNSSVDGKKLSPKQTSPKQTSPKQTSPTKRFGNEYSRVSRDDKSDYPIRRMGAEVTFGGKGMSKRILWLFHRPLQYYRIS